MLTTTRTSAKAGQPRNSFATRLTLLALAAFTYFVYAPVMRFGFVHDDIYQIVQNPRLDSWRSVPSYFAEHVWAHIAGAPANLYRPLFLFWLFLNNQLFGHESSGWHLTSLLLHLVVTFLVYVLGRKVLRNQWAAVFSAAAFALHPIHVEAVAWVSSVTEPLCAAFFLSAFLCYLRARSGEEKASYWMKLSLACYAAAMLAKETAAVLPAVILAFEWSQREQSPSAGKKLRNYGALVAPYAVVLAGYLGARWLALHSMAHRASDVPLLSALLTWPWLACFYLRMLVWPVGMGPSYDAGYVTTLAQARFLLPLAILATVVAGMFWWIRAKRSRLPVFLAFWFGATLAPAMAVFLVSPRYEGINDRYLYLPSVAFCLWLGEILHQMMSHQRTRFRIAVASLAIVPLFVLAFLCRRQLPYWETNYALFERATETAPQSVTAKMNLASEMVKRTQYREALQLARTCLQIEPHSVRAAGLAGQTSYLLGDFTGAGRYFEQALANDPTRADLYQSLAMAYISTTRYSDAEAVLRRGIALAPERAGLHYTLGKVLSWNGNWGAALEEFKLELKLNPESLPAQTAIHLAKANLEARSSTPQVRLTRQGLKP